MSRTVLASVLLCSALGSALGCAAEGAPGVTLEPAPVAISSDPDAAPGEPLEQQPTRDEVAPPERDAPADQDAPPAVASDDSASAQDAPPAATKPSPPPAADSTEGPGPAADAPAANSDSTAPGLPAADEPVIVRVAQDGSATFASLAEAVASAPPGAEIHIAAGVYRESLRPPHRMTLVAGGGPVAVDGAAAPALLLDAQAQVIVRGLRLVSSVAAIALGQGQLVLEDCVLEARPGGVAVETRSPQSQLVLRRCRVDVGTGRAFRLHPSTAGELRDCAVHWAEGHTVALDHEGPVPSLVVERTSFGWRRQNAFALLPAVLAVPAVSDGRMPLVVQPDASAWPGWARAGVTHFSTVAAALAAAGANMRVDLAPGVYAESVGLTRPVHLRSLGAAGSASLSVRDKPALFSNAAGHSTVTGLRLVSQLSERQVVVQVNAGSLGLESCAIEGLGGHGITITSSLAPGQASLDRCHVTADGRAVFATGPSTRVSVASSQLSSGSVAVLALDGASVRLVDSTLDAVELGVEISGPDASVELLRCLVGSMPRVVSLVKGASRSQLVTADLVVQPATAPLR